MTTSIGLRPIETNHQLLSQLSTPYSEVRRTSEPHLHSPTSSPADSESLGCFTSQSSTHSFTTTASSSGESTQNSTRTLKESQKAIANLTDTFTPEGHDMEHTGSSVGIGSITDALEIGTEVSRTSHRIRKPTSKAQALLGTRLYRSFVQEEPKSEQIEESDTNRSSTPTLDIQPQESNEDQSQNGPAVLEVNGFANALLSETLHELSNATATELTQSPVETNFPRRQSGRDRKPATRLIESSELAKAQKRKLSHNLIDSTPTKRVKLSITPSKLRNCLNLIADSQISATPSFISTEQVGTEKIKGMETAPILPSKDAIQPKRCIVVLKLSSSSLKFGDKKMEGEPLENPNVSNDERDSQMIATDQSISDCDLTCLPPESVFQACAQIAADWSDSDEDEDNTSNWNEQSKKLKERLMSHCKCLSTRRGPSQQNTRDNKPGTRAISITMK